MILVALVVVHQVVQLPKAVVGTTTATTTITTTTTATVHHQDHRMVVVAEEVAFGTADLEVGGKICGIETTNTGVRFFCTRCLIKRVT